jgi:hypothetical protein
MDAGSRGKDRAEVWLEACREALDLTRRQGEAIAVGDFFRLDALLRERGRLLAGLGDLREEEIEAGKLRSDERWEEVVQLLREIARLDEGNRRDIVARLGSLRGDLKKVEIWRRAARAYGGGQEIPDRGVEA